MQIGLHRGSSLTLKPGFHLWAPCGGELLTVLTACVSSNSGQLGRTSKSKFWLYSNEGLSVIKIIFLKNLLKDGQGIPWQSSG